jgi:hypothetical protein
MGLFDLFSGISEDTKPRDGGGNIPSIGMPNISLPDIKSVINPITQKITTIKDDLTSLRHAKRNEELNKVNPELISAAAYASSKNSTRPESKVNPIVVNKNNADSIPTILTSSPESIAEYKRHNQAIEKIEDARLSEEVSNNKREDDYRKGLIEYRNTKDAEAKARARADEQAELMERQRERDAAAAEAAKGKTESESRAKQLDASQGNGEDKKSESPLAKILKRFLKIYSLYKLITLPERIFGKISALFTAIKWIGALPKLFRKGGLKYLFKGIRVGFDKVLWTMFKPRSPLTKFVYKHFIRPLDNLIGKVLNPFKSIFGLGGNVAKNVSKAAGTVSTEVAKVGEGVDKVGETVTKTGNKFLSKFTGFFNNIAKKLLPLDSLNKAFSKFRGTYGKFTGTITKSINAVKTQIGKLLGPVTKVLGKVLNPVKGAVDAVKGVAKKVANTKVFKAVSGVASKVAKKVANTKVFKAVSGVASKVAKKVAGSRLAKAATWLRHPKILGKLGKKMLSKITPTLPKLASKVGVKMAAKGGKSALKQVPLLGAAIGIGDAIYDITKGDYVGAGLSLLSGIAPTLNVVAPGLGTAISMGAMGADIARDVLKEPVKEAVDVFDKETPESLEKEPEADLSTSAKEDSNKSELDEVEDEDNKKVKSAKVNDKNLLNRVADSDKVRDSLADNTVGKAASKLIPKGGKSKSAGELLKAGNSVGIKGSHSSDYVEGEGVDKGIDSLKNRSGKVGLVGKVLSVGNKLRPSNVVSTFVTPVVKKFLSPVRSILSAGFGGLRSHLKSAGNVLHNLVKGIGSRIFGIHTTLTKGLKANASVAKAQGAFNKKTIGKLGDTNKKLDTIIKRLTKTKKSSQVKAGGDIGLELLGHSNISDVAESQNTPQPQDKSKDEEQDYTGPGVKITNKQVLANQDKAMGYFTEVLGLSKNAAAALVGTLTAESNMNPGIVSYDGDGQGIAQWTGSRKGPVLAYINKANGTNYSQIVQVPLDMQLDAVAHELQNKRYNVLNMLKKPDISLKEAVDVVLRGYENGSDKNGGILASPASLDASYAKWGNSYNNMMFGKNGRMAQATGIINRIGDKVPGYVPQAGNTRYVARGSYKSVGAESMDKINNLGASLFENTLRGSGIYNYKVTGTPKPKPRPKPKAKVTKAKLTSSKGTPKVPFRMNDNSDNSINLTQGGSTVINNYNYYNTDKRDRTLNR